MARSKFDVVTPSTREEALDRVADAIRNSSPVTFTLVGHHDVPAAKEFDVAFKIRRISYFEDDNPTIQGKTESGDSVFVEIGTEAVKASVVRTVRQ